VDFQLPYETVLGMWRRCIATAYTPAEIYRRFAHQQRNTFPNRFDYPRNERRESWGNMVMGFGLLGRILWRIGIRGTYRRTFWRTAWPALRAGRIEQLIHIAVVSHHLIEFTRDCLGGAGESSFYAPAPTTSAPTVAAV
jgi:hopanoid C-2 methylase